MKKLGLLFLRFFCVTLFTSQAFAGLCKKWSVPEKIGTLDRKIDEASGIAISKADPNRIYHINDSGSKGEFLVTDFSGQLQKKVSIEGFKPFDTEDMSLGPCGNDSCLFIADTGDNFHMKLSSKIIAIKEQRAFSGKAQIFATFKIKYPDRVSHNVEAFAIHPNGDLVVVTKEYNEQLEETETAKVFWMSAADLWNHPGDTKTLHQLGEIDVAALLNDKTINSLVTSLSISPKGDRFSLLTYSSILEFNFDISKGVKSEILAADFSIVPTKKLRQQEAVSYSANKDAVIYTTEDKNAPLYQVLCQSR